LGAALLQLTRNWVEPPGLALVEPDRVVDRVPSAWASSPSGIEPENVPPLPPVMTTHLAATLPVTLTVPVTVWAMAAGATARASRAAAPRRIVFFISSLPRSCVGGADFCLFRGMHPLPLQRTPDPPGERARKAGHGETLSVTVSESE